MGREKYEKKKGAKIKESGKREKVKRKRTGKKSKLAGKSTDGKSKYQKRGQTKKEEGVRGLQNSVLSFRSIGV